MNFWLKPHNIKNKVKHNNKRKTRNTKNNKTGGWKNKKQNPPSIIPNLNFHRTTARPYWLLQRNRTHLSFIEIIHFILCHSEISFLFFFFFWNIFLGIFWRNCFLWIYFYFYFSRLPLKNHHNTPNQLTH